VKRASRVGNASSNNSGFGSDLASLSCVPPILIDTENTLNRVGVPVANPIEADCETAEWLGTLINLENMSIMRGAALRS
jgi:hypothetical protein